MATLRTQYENYLFVNQEPHISFEEWERRIYTPKIESFIKIWEREETIKKWEDTGLLDGLDKDMTIKTQKVNLSGLMESDMPIRQQNALKNTFPDIEIQKEVEPQSQLDELNDYLKMLSDMDKIGIRRKIVLLEGYINKIKNNIK
jgi:hypothetical protein